MNDRSARTPESRLRDALDAAAHTIPESAQPPGLVAPVRANRSKPTWVIAVAAAATLVAAIAIPLTVQRDRSAPVSPACPGGQFATPDKMPMDQLPTVNSPSPDTLGDERRQLAALPVGAPPRVPYTVTNETGAGYLQDGNTRVPLPGKMQTQVIERLDCRWLVVRTKLLSDGNPSSKEVGILDATGRFVRLGRSEPNMEDKTKGLILGLSVAMSPDGGKIAYTYSTPDRRSFLAAVSIANGKQIASVPVSGTTEVLAWNGGGIWLHSGNVPKEENRFARWQPGSAISPIAGQGMLYAYRTTDRMVWKHGQVPNQCATVVDIDLVKQMETCARLEWNNLSLSPDGQFLIHADKVWRVADRSEIPPPNWWETSPRFVWEDNTHLLLPGGDNVLVRCAIDTRVCERVFVSAAGFNLDLPEQGPYKFLGMG